MIRILSLGDSYTIGEGVTASERWPMQLAALLRARGFEVAEPAIIAQTGWTTDELSRAIDEESPIGPYDLVTLLIGVNNQYRERSAEDYREELRLLLARGIGLAGGHPRHVIVLSIPDWGVTPFARDRDAGQIAREIDRFNQINREEAARSGVRYVDVAPVSREAGRRPGLLAGDGLHPSGEMYREWAALVEPEAAEAATPR